MNSLYDTALECNPYTKINFDGGDLSSDAGLLLIKDFIEKIGLKKLVYRIFRTNDTAYFRFHSDPKNLLQMVYQIIAGYFRDDCADELTIDPIFVEALNGFPLASQPTLSRFFNRMDDTTLDQFEQISKMMRETIYSIKPPDEMLFDLDSTLLNTYGNQEGEAFNYHYQAHGYHPLMVFDGHTGDLLKMELRDGTHYCSKGSGDFIRPLLQEYRLKYPSLPLYLRGDSGFAAPELYEACEANNCKYAIRLKINPTLMDLVSDKTSEFIAGLGDNLVDHAVTYGEFTYQAKSWSKSRRVVYKIEKPENQMVFTHTFVVTTMDDVPDEVIAFYYKRGNMENFIKECKLGFDFSSVSSKTKIVNANRLQLHGLAYNIFNWFRRIALAANMRKQRIDTVRLKLIKIAAKVVHKARYTYYKLCSSCPYQDEFVETLQNIREIELQLQTE